MPNRYLFPSGVVLKGPAMAIDIVPKDFEEKIGTIRPFPNGWLLFVWH